MPHSELIFGGVLVTCLLGVAVLFGWTQRGAFGRAEQLPHDERRIARRQIYRRLIGCAFLAVVAILLAAQYMLWECRVKAIVPPLNDQDRMVARLWLATVIGLLLALLVVLILAAIEAFVARSQALKQYRKRSDDRRALIERQAARLLEGRNE